LVTRAVLLIVLRGATGLLDLIRFERTDHPRRRTDDQGVLGKLLAFGDDRTCADDAVAADLRAVHHDCPHADQRAVLDRATVKDDVVADGAILADRERKTEI